MAARHGLGRGLEALIKDGTPSTPEQAAGIERVAAASIRKSPLQPRHEFDEEAMADLARSIREHGVLQPLLVRRREGAYELIAGERRLRAAGEAGLTEVPVIVMEVSDDDALELALIENLQREDLNPIEEAEAYRVLIETFGLTQEQAADRVGKARASVANSLRLLGLPETVKALVREDKLSEGHAKLLSGLEIPEEQVLYAQRTVKEGLSVRNLEALLRRARRALRKPRAVRSDLPADHLNYLSDELHGRFGTGVRIRPSRTYANGKKGKGTIEIDFYSNEELDRILEIMGIQGE